MASNIEKLLSKFDKNIVVEDFARVVKEKLDNIGVEGFEYVIKFADSVIDTVFGTTEAEFRDEVTKYAKNKRATFNMFIESMLSTLMFGGGKKYYDYLKTIAARAGEIDIDKAEDFLKEMATEAKEWVKANEDDTAKAESVESVISVYIESCPKIYNKINTGCLVFVKKLGGKISESYKNIKPEAIGLVYTLFNHMIYECFVYYNNLMGKGVDIRRLSIFVKALMYILSAGLITSSKGLPFDEELRCLSILGTAFSLLADKVLIGLYNGPDLKLKLEQIYEHQRGAELEKSILPLYIEVDNTMDKEEKELAVKQLMANEFKKAMGKK